MASSVYNTKYKQFLFKVLLIALFSVGCGVSRRSVQSSTGGKVNHSYSNSANDKGAQVSSREEVHASLMQAYRDWKGTPYQLGGNSKKGIDCSALVSIILDQYFGVSVPGNTRAQLSVGKHIRKSHIQAGDLIFFQTGRKVLHVGIAVNKGEFLHASTSNGVRISKLGRQYWQKHFFRARRIFNM